jgi:hypothetical protein
MSYIATNALAILLGGLAGLAPLLVVWRDRRWLQIILSFLASA